MTLEEAIKHCEEVAEDKFNEAQESIMCNRFQYADDCRDCAEEHRQLAEWLKELKAYRDDSGDCDYKTLKIKLENAEDVIRGLQEDLRDAREELKWR